MLVTPFSWLRFGVTRRSVLVTPFWCDLTKSDRQNGPPKRSHQNEAHHQYGPSNQTFKPDHQIRARKGIFENPHAVYSRSFCHFRTIRQARPKRRCKQSYYQMVVEFGPATLNEFSDAAPTTTTDFPRHDRTRYGTGQSVENDDRERNGQTGTQAPTADSVSELY